MSSIKLSLCRGYTLRGNKCCTNFQLGNPDDRCGEVLNRNLTEDEKMLVMDLHNQKRMHIANGLEERGDPGPQPPAANMMELVNIEIWWKW